MPPKKRARKKGTVKKASPRKPVRKTARRRSVGPTYGDARAFLRDLGRNWARLGKQLATLDRSLRGLAPSEPMPAAAQRKLEKFLKFVWDDTQCAYPFDRLFCLHPWHLRVKKPRRK